MMPKYIALLVCDTPSPEVVAEHGAYPQIFSELMRESLPEQVAKETDEIFKMDSYDVVHKMEYPAEEKIDDYDAFMITGSVASAYANLEWIDKAVDFTARLARNHPRAKIFGICFGHQIVARALGGECVKNDGKWEIGPTPMEITALGEKIFGVDILNIQEMHQDHVPFVPAGFHLLASTDISVNQAMVSFLGASYASVPTPSESEPSASSGDDILSKAEDPTNIHIITVQGHPEFTKPIIQKIVDKRTKQGILTEALKADFERRVDWRNDGLLIARVFWRILGIA